MQHRTVIITTLGIKLKSNFHIQAGKNKCPFNLKMLRENPDKIGHEVENIDTGSTPIENLRDHICSEATRILTNNYPAEKMAKKKIRGNKNTTT